MEYSPYTAVVTAIVALIVGFDAYRRRKPRKTVNFGYCTFSVPPGGDPEKDGIRIRYRKRPG